MADLELMDTGVSRHLHQNKIHRSCREHYWNNRLSSCADLQEPQAWETFEGRSESLRLTQWQLLPNILWYKHRLFPSRILKVEGSSPGPLAKSLHTYV